MKIIMRWGWGGDSVSSLLRSRFRRLLMAVTRVEGTLQGKGAAPGRGSIRGLLLGTSIAPKTTDWT